MSEITIDALALNSMRDKAATSDPGAEWWCYQNVAMDSANFGHCIFLQVGPGCTLAEPPPQGPDGVWGLGWRYRPVGPVDLDSGQVTPRKTPTAKD